MSKLLSIFILLSGIINASNSELVLLRDHYVNAAKSESDFKKYCSYMDGLNIDDPTVQGYIAVKYFFKAKYGWNPISRVSDFNKGAENLDECILKNPSNVELRYLRLAIQVKSPSFLGYSNDVNSDKEIILKNLQEMHDYDLKSRMSDFLLEEMELDENEKQKLSS